MTTPLVLPAREQQLYDLLVGKDDVAIVDLYEALGGPTEAAYTPQEWLGPYVTRLNRRLRNLKMKVQPGELKKTYRLVVV